MRLALAVLILLGGMLAAVIAAEDRRPRAEVVLAQSADCYTLDPQRMTYQQDLRVAAGLYEGLVASDPDTDEPVPAAARSWTSSPDGLEWRFEIDPDARWSNGDPVTSGDFRAGLRRALLPDLAADYSGLLMPIAGAEEFFRWRAERLASFVPGEGAAEALWEETLDRFDQTVGIECPDDRTLVIRLARPVPTFLSLLAFPVASPVHRPTLEQFASLDPETGRRREDSGWLRPGTLVSNGPYVLARRRFKRDLRLEPNPFFRDAGRVASRSIEVVVIEDPSTSVLAFVAGEVDWLTDVSASYRADLLASRRRWIERHAPALDPASAEDDAVLAALPAPGPDERRDVHAVPRFGTDFFHFNCNPALPDGRPNPFADAAVRRAFSLAVDRELLTSRVTRLDEPIARTLVPPGAVPGYAGPQGLPHDPDRARRELAAAGWIDRDGDGRVEDADGGPFPTIDLLYSTNSPRYRDLSLALERTWEQELGVDVEPRGQEQRFYKDDLRRGRFMIGRGGWYGDFLDPLTFLDLCRTGDGNNVRGYSSRRVDELLARADRERDRAARLRLLAEAERIIVEEDLPVLPICRFVTVGMHDPASFRGLARGAMRDQWLDRLRTPRSTGPAASAAEWSP